MPNTTPALDEPSRAGAGSATRRPRPGRRSSCSRTARSRPGGPGSSWPRSASSPTRASSGFRDDGAPVRSASLFRNALAYAGMLGLPIVDHPEDATLTERRGGERGAVATVLGLRGWPAAAEAGAVARDLAILADVVRDVPGARLHLTHLSTAGVARARPRGEGPWPAGHLRRDAASPRAHRRVARRGPALELGGARRRRRRPRPVAGRRDHGAAVRPVAAGQPAAPLGGRCRGLPRRARSTARPTRSPPTTPPTPRSTRPSSSGSRPTGSAASRRRSGSSSRPSTRGACRSPRRSRRSRPARRASSGSGRPAAPAARPRRGRAGRPRRLRPVRLVAGGHRHARLEGQELAAPRSGAARPRAPHGRRWPPRLRGARSLTWTANATGRAQR